MYIFLFILQWPGRLSGQLDTLSDTVELVDLFWRESLSNLTDVLQNQIHKYSIADVFKAEGVLLQMKKCHPDKEKMSELSKEFYSIIKHKEKEGGNCPIDNLRMVSQKFDLCQVFKFRYYVITNVIIFKPVTLLRYLFCYVLDFNPLKQHYYTSLLIEYPHQRS